MRILSHIAVSCIAVLLLVACGVQNKARDAKTKAIFSQIISAIEQYENEYGEPIPAKTSIELADVLESKNKKRIFFYSFGDDGRNEAGEILDAYGNPATVTNQDGHITLYSYGKNGIMDSGPSSDDIVMHYKSTKHNQARDDNSE